MSLLGYYRGIRIILLILLTVIAWYTFQENIIPLTHGIPGLLIDFLLLVMIDIKIKDHENNL